ncbi:hypothetical protein J7E49_21415 [Variovorax paradoxus]|nr:hypothetical protein [Variovorax paradoxus]
MNLFIKKNKALEDARTLLKAAQIGQLRAQQDLDWAESMRIYHKLREESLVEFIARLEKLEAGVDNAHFNGVAVDTAVPAVPTLSAPKTTVRAIKTAAPPRRAKHPTGGLVDQRPQAA